MCSLVLHVCAVDFSETLPLFCVPSFTGRLVRYTWKLSIGACRGLNADAKIIRIPFQVMTVPGGCAWGGVSWWEVREAYGMGSDTVILCCVRLCTYVVEDGGVMVCVWGGGGEGGIGHLKLCR